MALNAQAGRGGQTHGRERILRSDQQECGGVARSRIPGKYLNGVEKGGKSRFDPLGIEEVAGVV
jgi:hypothetical protein